MDYYKDSSVLEAAIASLPDDEVEKTASTEEKIYDTLMSRAFDEWYEKEWKDHVSGEEKSKSKEEILKDIKSMF